MSAPHTSIASAAVPGWAELRPTASRRVLAVPGQGSGPEVVAAALVVLEAVSLACDLGIEVELAGRVWDDGPHGPTLGPGGAAVFDAARQSRTPVLCGAVSGRFVYDLRAHGGLYCKLVPVRPLAELDDAAIVRPERRAGVDVLIVRDNASGLYQGRYGWREPGQVAFHETEYAAGDIDRCLTVAVRAASARDGRLAIVTKTGGVPTISELWRDRARRLAAERVELCEIEVDNACYQLVADARRFDVVATPNMLGDIVADTAALVLGSRGMALSANFGADGWGVYQTGHGAAYDIAGTDTANPVAQIQSMAMLLRESFGLDAAADLVEQAVATVLGAGVRTPDIAAGGSRVVGTTQMARAIADEVLRSAADAA